MSEAMQLSLDYTAYGAAELAEYYDRLHESDVYITLRTTYSAHLNRWP